MKRLHPCLTGCLVVVAMVLGWFAAIFTQSNYADFRPRLQQADNIIVSRMDIAVKNRSNFEPQKAQFRISATTVQPPRTQPRRTPNVGTNPKLLRVIKTKSNEPIQGNSISTMNAGTNSNFRAIQTKSNTPIQGHSISNMNAGTNSNFRAIQTNSNTPIQVNSNNVINKQGTMPIIRTKVYNRDSKQWNEDTNICYNLPAFRKATLRLNIGSTPIYIHEPKVDMYVSGSLARSGTWEGGMISIILDLLRRNPNAQFMDLGANLGVYSLAAAKLGRKVIAVDPLQMNIQRMCKSFEDGRISENVTLVYNALSDEIQNVTLGKDRNNIGGTFVIQNKNSNKVKGSVVVGKYSDVIMTAHLDHVMELPGFDIKEVIVKMDVEGYEMKVLKSGIQFFDKINVLALLMEWNYHRTGLTGKEIIKFFNDRHFEAYSPSLIPTKLLNHQSQRWPNDIIWKKTKTF